jgi:ribonuclease PH
MQHPDGRACNQLRPVSVTRGYLSHPHGSVLIEVGGTKVICSVSIDKNDPVIFYL